VDVISDVLRVVRFSGSVVFTARCAAPWALASPDPQWLAGALPGPVRHAIPFHALVDGSAIVRGDAWEIALDAGDLILLPGGDPHSLHDGEAPIRSVATLIDPPPWRVVPEVAIDGGGSATRFMCGFFAVESTVFNPLLGALPRVVVVRSRRTPLRALLDACVRSTVDELHGERAGAEAAIARLTELLFVEAVRSSLSTHAEGEMGWLAVLRDPIVGKALEAVHAEPTARWTLETLARRAAASRSSFSARFRKLVGHAPMHYVTRWRMQLAARELQTTDAPIAAIADRFGYASEAAFHRAFRRFAGRPPAEWRRASRGTPPNLTVT